MASASPSANQGLKMPSDSKVQENGYGGCECLSVLPVEMPTACWYILVVELCERLAFYTFNGTMAFFLERVGFSLVGAGGFSACMTTLCFILALIASWVADAVCGRFKTILFAGAVYILGSFSSAFATLPGSENIGLFFVGMLFLVPLATAGIKANLSNLGADQYDMTEPGQEAAQERFFFIFYLFINVGSLVSYGFMTTFASNGGLGVPQSYGYFAAYLLAGLFMLIATGIFLWGSGRYRKVPTQECSAIYSVAHSLGALSRRGSFQASSICIGVGLLLSSVILSIVQAFVPKTGSMAHVLVLIGFACATCGLVAIVLPCSNTTWLVRDVASFEEHPTSTRTSSSTPSREDVRGFLDLLPVLFLGNIAFNALYNCMAFWYQQQACQMDLRLTASIQLAGSFFNVADCIAIIVVTPLAVDWLNPLVAAKTRGNFGLGAKFGVGMGFGIISVLAAALMEVSRRGALVLGVPSQCAPPGVDMSAFPSVWMLFPYFFMGVGEIYCNPTLMHFAYTRSPVSMRTLAAAVSFFIQAVATSLFALLLDVVQKFVPNDLNNGHLEYGYLISICIGIVFYMLFLRCCDVARPEGENGI